MTQSTLFLDLRPPATPKGKLRVLDLCCGLGGWGEAFRDHGHDVVGLDIDPRFKARLTMDLREFAKDPVAHMERVGGVGWRPDIILASPPCEGFSVASMGRMWESGGANPVPKHPTSRLGLEILRAALLVHDAFPEAPFVMENPRGMMTNVMRAERRWEPIPITYCRYGLHYQKPTRIWVANFPELTLREPCGGHPKTTGTSKKGDALYVNGRDGQPCHEAASRGAKTGVQGLKDSAARALIPWQLSNDVRLAAEARRSSPSAS